MFGYPLLMALPWQKPRTSFTRGPDYSAKQDAVGLLRGNKKTPSEADYKPATDDSKKRCHECRNYGKPGESESDCGVVVGIVKAEGVCDMWTQRPYDAPSTTEIVIKVNGNTG